DCERSCDIVVRSSTQNSLWIKAQPLLLTQFVENLLDNACKYSPPGQPIILRTGEEAGNAVIAVEDSGCGISAADLTRVFEPFFRASSTKDRRIRGAGLGLAVVERIVRAFGGVVTAHSEVGCGTRFEVRLPVTEVSDQAIGLEAL